VALKIKDTDLKTQWATAIACKANSEDRPKPMQDPQILEALELLMPEKDSANTDVYASSEEDTNVGEGRIQPGSLRTQLHVDVDNLGDVRIADIALQALHPTTIDYLIGDIKYQLRVRRFLPF
jgi:hypothetical protein